MKTWHKIALGISLLLALASLSFAIFSWSNLPQVIPTHFGFNGQPDAWSNKSIFYVFLVTGLQFILTGLFVFLYFKPQYSDMPTTLLLMGMEEKKRNHAFDLIRTMLVVVAVWLNVLFLYVAYMMNSAAFNNSKGLNPWIMLGLIFTLFVWLAFYTVRVYKVTKELMVEKK